jgi:hypothetical protein
MASPPVDHSVHSEQHISREDNSQVSASNNKRDAATFRPLSTILNPLAGYSANTVVMTSTLADIRY